MGLVRIIAPAVEALSLEEARRQLGFEVEGSPETHPDDTAIEEKIAEAVSHLDGKDGILGRCLVEQSWEWTLDRFPRGAMKVPLPPLRRVDSIVYYDTSNVLTTWATSKYQVDATTEPGRIQPVFGESYPDTYDRLSAVKVTFTAGYEPSEASPADYRANIPAAIKSALKLLLSDLWEHREAQFVGISSVTNERLRSLLANFQRNTF